MTAKRPISKRSATYRLRKVADRISPAEWDRGAEWYPAAREMTVAMENLTDVPAVNCAVVLAQLSPCTRWQGTVRATWTTLTTGQAPASYPMVRRELAWAAMVSDMPFATLSGPKTTAFAQNLTGDDQAVTIDVWMQRAFGITETELKRPATYPVLVDVARKVAAEHCVTPATLQSAVWIHIRGSAE